MPLAPYTNVFWLPDGTLASNTALRVFPLMSNTLANLYTDGTGATPLGNPVTTDGSGIATFWAEEGEYWLHINAQAYRVAVGSPDLDTFEASTAVSSTALLSGGELNVNAGVPTSIDISATVGYVMDFLTDPEIPTLARVSVPAQTVPLNAAALLRVITWWMLDSTGAVIQQAARPTNAQRRSFIVLGATVYDAVLGAIVEDQSLPVLAAQPANQLADLMDAMGPFSITGNVITPNGVNLSLNKSAGPIFARAFNRFAGPVLTQDPHVTQTPAQTPVSLRRLSRTPQFPLPPAFTTIDPTTYDNAGVLTPVTGNNATIQRVWLFPANSVSSQIAVQYGETQYPDLTSALNRLGAGDYVVNPATVGNAALIGYIVVRGTATDLSNTAQCIIKRSSKLDYP